MVHTLQSVNGPLLKLLEGDLRCWRRLVEVQPEWVVLLLVGGCGELAFFMVDDSPALGVNSMCVLPDHDVRLAVPQYVLVLEFVGARFFLVETRDAPTKDAQDHVIRCLGTREEEISGRKK